MGNASASASLDLDITGPETRVWRLEFGAVAAVVARPPPLTMLDVIDTPSSGSARYVIRDCRRPPPVRGLSRGQSPVCYALATFANAPTVTWQRPWLRDRDTITRSSLSIARKALVNDD